MITRTAALTYWVIRSDAGLVKFGQYCLGLLGLLFSQGLFGQSVGGVTSGAASYCDSVNSGFISLQFYTGSIVKWEQSNDGVNWQTILNTTSTQSYNQLKLTTSFRAIVQDANFPPDTSTVSTITVHVPGVAGFIAGGDTVCSGANSGSLLLTSTQGTVLSWQSRVGSGPWQNINDTTFQYSYSNLLVSTAYRAVVRRVPGCVADTSAYTNVGVDETTIRGNIFGGASVCYGTDGDTLVLTGARGTSFTWLSSLNAGQTWTVTQTGSSTNYVYPTVTDTIWYVVVVKNGVCPADTTSQAVIVSYPQVIADAGPDQNIRRLETVQLGGSSSGGTIRWEPTKWLSDSTSANPEAKPRITTNYKIFVTDSYGCESSDSALITVEIPFPTAITPNGDGVNDTFEIYEVEKFPKCELHIYDRWGNLVFEANAYHNEWGGRSKDGTVLPESTYYYTFDYGAGDKPVSGYVLIKR